MCISPPGWAVIVTSVWNWSSSFTALLCIHLERGISVHSLPQSDVKTFESITRAVHRDGCTACWAIFIIFKGGGNLAGDSNFYQWVVKMFKLCLSQIFLICLRLKTVSGAAHCQINLSHCLSATLGWVLFFLSRIALCVSLCVCSFSIHCRLCILVNVTANT